jgi:beta-glucanase (GH16 family)
MPELHVCAAARLIATTTLLFGALMFGGTSSARDLSPQAETPVWRDEFDTEGLPDASRWDYEVGFVRNKERQFYTRRRPENARVEKGMLVIEARREVYENAQYTSASLTSRGNWRYGRLEVRAKLPKGRGTWPAIWTLGTNIRDVGWPACGEIDIMEHVGDARTRGTASSCPGPMKTFTSIPLPGRPLELTPSSMVNATSRLRKKMAETRCGRSTSLNT